jgi:hypothetical protein
MRLYPDIHHHNKILVVKFGGGPKHAEKSPALRGQAIRVSRQTITSST